MEHQDFPILGPETEPNTVQSRPSFQRWRLVLLGLAACLLPALGSAQTPDYSVWQEAIKDTYPSGLGCFQAFYPDTQWQPVACEPPPLNPPQPSVQPLDESSVMPSSATLRPLTIGGHAGDYMATASGAPISSATGSFINFAGGLSSLWSLQLNSNTFTLTDNNSIALCGGSGSCSGWVQFVYNSKYDMAFIQYWMFNATKCPAGWITHPGGSTGAAGCYFNAAYTNGFLNSSPASIYNINFLGNLKIAGRTANGTDTVTLIYGGAARSQSTTSTFKEFYKTWEKAGFNIFGDCCSYDVSFTYGSKLTVNLGINNGTTNAPLCNSDFSTAESNNLYLNSPCCPSGGASPAITYAESSTSGTTVSCSSLGVPDPYTVTARAVNGSISMSGKTTVAPRSTLSFALSPSSASDIPSVGGTCGGTLSSDLKTYTTNPITTHCTVEASFGQRGGGSDGSSSGGGGAMGWVWGLGLWGLATAALRQRRHKALNLAHLSQLAVVFPGIEPKTAYKSLIDKGAI